MNYMCTLHCPYGEFTLCICILHPTVQYLRLILVHHWVSKVYHNNNPVTRIYGTNFSELGREGRDSKMLRGVHFCRVPLCMYTVWDIKKRHGKSSIWFFIDF
jgi:hypothetical protein